MDGKLNVRSIAICAMIAGAYTALCLTLPLTSYGPLQIRVAEALTILAVFSPLGICGVTLGCAISNLWGWLSGANPIGMIDTVVGTSATLISAIFAWHFRNVRYKGLPVLSSMFPVVINALVIGVMLRIMVGPTLLLHILFVGLGQLIACVGLGLLLFKALERRNILQW